MYLFFLMQLGRHPVAVVHFTFTHKQYTEYREWNIHNYKLKVRAVSRLCKLYTDICLRTEEKARKTLSNGSRKVPRYPGGSSTVHIYTQTVHRIQRAEHT
jgi:hypothetical protein